MTIDAGTAHMILDRCQPPNAPGVTSMAIKSVLSGLASCAKPCCPLFPSVAEIAARARCSTRTVHRAIGVMESAGVLVVERRTRDSGGKTSSAYMIDFAQLAAWGGVTLSHGPCHPVTSHATPCHMGGDTVSHPIKEEPATLTSNSKCNSNQQPRVRDFEVVDVPRGTDTRADSCADEGGGSGQRQHTPRSLLERIGVGGRQLDTLSERCTVEEIRQVLRAVNDDPTAKSKAPCVIYRLREMHGLPNPKKPKRATRESQLRTLRELAEAEA